MVIFFLFTWVAQAVWLDDIYGHPPRAYFVAHQKMLQWGKDRNQLSLAEEKQQQECLRKVDGWYLPHTRTPQFEVRISYDANKEKIVYRWMCRTPNSSSAESPYVSGAMPEHQWAPLIIAHRKEEGGSYSLELSAYVEMGLPKELTKEIQAVRAEFGFMADTWHFSSVHGLEVAFP
jgi:hypothetical protein